MISWVDKGQLPEKAETRGKAREVLVGCSIFNSAVFKIKDGVLMFTKAANTKIHYVRKRSNTTCRQGVSYTFSREENNVSVYGRHVRRRQEAE